MVLVMKDYFNRVSGALKEFLIVLSGNELEIDYMQAYGLIGQRMDELKNERYPSVSFYCEPCFGYLMNLYWEINHNDLIDTKNTREYNQLMRKLIEDYAQKAVEEAYRKHVKGKG